MSAYKRMKETQKRRGCFQTALCFIYNPDKNAYFGKTSKEWARRFTFYLFFYSFLAAYWSGMLYVFCTQILNEDHPRYVSILKFN